MKFTALFALLLSTALMAGQPRFSRESTAQNAPKILVTETQEIRVALDQLMRDSETFRDLVYDAFQFPDDAPVIPVYAARLGPDETAAISMHASGKTGNIYLDLTQIHRNGLPLHLVIAAQVKAFHDIFVAHRDNPMDYYNAAFMSPRSGAGGRIAQDANRFAENVRFDMGLPPVR